MADQSGAMVRGFDASVAVQREIVEAMLGIRAKYGKNSILKGMNYDHAATGRERNEQIGGHKRGQI